MPSGEINNMGIKSLLLENKSAKQTILKNTFWLAFSQALVKLIKLLLVIYVAKILSTVEYGKFCYALSFAGLFAVLVDMGINSIFVREMASDNEKQKFFASLLSFKILLAFLVWICIFSLSFVISADVSVRWNIWILGASVVIAGLASFFLCFFQAHQKMELTVIADVIQALSTTALGLFLIFKVPLSQYLSLGYLAGSICLLLTAIWLASVNQYHIGIGFDVKIWGEFLKMSWPLALGSLFINAFSATDSLMIGYMKNVEEVGFYNAAQRIMTLAALPVGFIATSFFPALSKASKQGLTEVQKIFDFESEIVIILALPIVFGGVALAPRLISYVYDAKFLPAVLVLRMLLIVLLFHYFSYPFNQILVAHNKQVVTFWITVVTSLIDIVLNLMLIPRYGLYGATATTIVSAFISFIALLGIFVKYRYVSIVGFRTIKIGITSLLACIAMYSLLVNPFVYHLNVFLSVPIGAFAYFLVFSVFSWASGGKFSLLQKARKYILENKRD